MGNRIRDSVGSVNGHGISARTGIRHQPAKERNEPSYERNEMNLLSFISKVVRPIGEIKGLHYLTDGIASLIRLPTGEAVEIIIRPARYSTHFPNLTKHRREAK